MDALRKLDLVWALLLGLTFGGAVLGDASRPGFWITAGIALIMAVKGRLVIDFFMELGGANRTIRRLVRLYGMAIPLLLILSYLFATQIAQMTALG